jgi:VWFA-related protein
MTRGCAAFIVACLLGADPPLSVYLPPEGGSHGIGGRHGDQQPAVFRSNVDLVSVPVLVRENNRPVVGLTAKDFQITDNGVPQQVTSTAIEALAVDVTLVLDASGSVQNRLEGLKKEIQEIAETLHPNDRVRLISFATGVVQVFELQPGGTALPLERLTAGGGTAFYNALAAALITVPDSTRPQMVFAFSDGVDTVSFLDGERVISLAGRTSASLYVGLVAGIEMRGPVGVDDRKPDKKRLQEAVIRTGGALVDDVTGTGLSGVFAKALEQFRTSYMLRYSPQGVPAAGWHEIVVTIARPGKFDVRARRGYEGG